MRAVELTVGKPDSPEVAIRGKKDRGWLNAISSAADPDDVEPEGEYSAQPLLANVALALPFGYLRETRPAVIVLPVRGDRLTNGFHGVPDPEHGRRRPEAARRGIVVGS